MLPSGRWALTPPFHPYQALSPSAIRLRGLLSGCLKVFLQMATEAHCTGGLFSVALSVAETSQHACARRAKSQPPGVTRRVAPWSEAPSAEDFRPKRKTRRPRCPDFPPGLPSCEGWPSDHPACPPRSVYHLAPLARSADSAEQYTEMPVSPTKEFISAVRDLTWFRFFFPLFRLQSR